MAYGKISINGKDYDIAPVESAYKVTEVPNHGDVDPKMERRVIWRQFSLGIQRRRENPSLDAQSLKSTTFTYMRQIHNPEGIYWAQGCDTTRQDRIFAQRMFVESNFSKISPKNDAPFTFLDGSLVSLAITPNRAYTLSPPGTWTLSAQFSSANEITDAIQYGGQIYIALGPTYGKATSITATTLTDSSANWVNGQFTNATLTVGSVTATVTSNTSTVLTFAGGWSGATPTSGTYTLTKGIWTWDQISTDPWIQQPNTIAGSYFTVIREQLWRALGPNIYSTINTVPSNQIWSGATVIGDPNTNITGLDTFKDFLMIFKQDGIYSADKTGAVYPIFPGFKTLGTNPRPLGQFEDNYLFAADNGLIWSYTPRGGVRRIGFDFAEPYPMDPNNAVNVNKFSVPNAVRRGIPLTHYMLTAFSQYNPSSTSQAWVLAWDGNGWHPFHYDSDANTANGIGLTGGNTAPSNPVVHFSHLHADGTNHVYYLQNPLLDPFIAQNFDFTPQIFYLPVDNGALEDEYKVIERINVIVDNPEAGTVNIAYAVDENIASLTFQDLGQPQFGLTRGDQFFVPASPLPSYNRICLRVTIQCNQPSNTSAGAVTSPAVRTVVLHYKQRSPQRREWDVILLADDNIIGPSGRLDVRRAGPMIADLNKARVNHTQVNLIDALGNTVQVYVDEVAEDIKVLKGTQAPAYLVTVKLFESTDGR